MGVLRIEMQKTKKLIQKKETMGRTPNRTSQMAEDHGQLSEGVTLRKLDALLE